MKQRDMTMQKYLANIIRTNVDNNGVKLIHVAKQIGVSIDRLSNIVNCNRHITAEEFINICQYLGVDPRTVYNDTHSA